MLIQVLMSAKPIVAVWMGSRSDWEVLQEASRQLDAFQIPHECHIVSAHRTPDRLSEWSKAAQGQGIEVIIAGAGGAAHLPGMVAAHTELPVLGVPVPGTHLQGMDSLLSIVQMPKGIPVATFAVGKSGAINAALFAASILARSRPELRTKIKNFREMQTETVLKEGPLK